MGHKSSVLKVSSRLTVPNDCDAVDAIRLSYKSRSCCGSRRRVVASFSFPRDQWQQLSPQGMLLNASADVATVRVGKLQEKDGSAPVRVSCLAGKVTVYQTEMSLADLLARLKYTEGGGKAVLSFSLAGRRMDGSDAAGPTFTVLFCNGKRLDDGGAQRLSGPPHQHQADHCSEPNSGLSEEVTPGHGVDHVMGKDVLSVNVEGKDVEVIGKDNPSLDVEYVDEEGKVMGEEDPSLDQEWETEEEEVMGEEDPSLGEESVDEQEEVMDEDVPSMDLEYVPESQGHVRYSVWDHVADGAVGVALALVVYWACVEYITW